MGSTTREFALTLLGNKTSKVIGDHSLISRGGNRKSQNPPLNWSHLPIATLTFRISAGLLPLAIPLVGLGTRRLRYSLEKPWEKLAHPLLCNTKSFMQVTDKRNGRSATLIQSSDLNRCLGQTTRNLRALLETGICLIRGEDLFWCDWLGQAFFL